MPPSFLWYQCTNEACGHRNRGWAARCPKCSEFSLKIIEPGAVNTITTDMIPEAPPDPTPDELDEGAQPVALCDVADEPIKRDGTGFPQIDEVLGGGLVEATVLLLSGDPGAGKCLGRGTPVLRMDGRVVPVEDVRYGDLLAGPDGKPRRVLGTNRGVGELYRIIPTTGDSWICNRDHVLTLVYSGRPKKYGDQPFDMSLDEWFSKGPEFKHHAKMFSVGVDQFDDDEGETSRRIDPYFLGLWFGDGTKEMRANAAGDLHLAKVQITKPDVEVRLACEAEAARWGLRFHERNDEERCPSYQIVFNGDGNWNFAESNPLLMELRSLVGRDLTIPRSYSRAPRAERLAFLAGIIDSDGDLDKNCFSVTQKREDWAREVWWMARSLGLCATIASRIGRCKLPSGDVFEGTYWRVTISGNTDMVPTRIPRKQAGPRGQKKDATRTGFRVDSLGEGEYFGFELDGDGRFLLGDFTVTHNTTLTLQIAERSGMRVLYTSGEESVKQISQRAHRLDIDTHRITLFAENNLDRILKHAVRLKTEMLVIDSIQTVSDPRIRGESGSPTQVKACTKRLMDFAKTTNVVVWIIGHITNEGKLAGPKTLKHLVDVVLWIDVVNAIRRHVKCHGKNRFGPSNVTARLDLTNEGMVEVTQLMSGDGDDEPDTENGEGSGAYWDDPKRN